LQNDIPRPQDIKALLQSWDSLYPFQAQKQSYASGLWSALPRFVLWGLWLERNNRVFRDKERSVPLVGASVQTLFGDWANSLSQQKCSRMMDEEEELWLAQFKIQKQKGSIDSTTHQEEWEIRTGKEEFDNWKKERKAYILSFDGASKGNPGQAGGGGILESPNAETLLRYALGLGTATNNCAEAMALWQGLRQANKQGIRNLVIIGDSRIIIKAIIQPSKNKNAQLNNLLE
jgi:hypothetical protein